MTHCLRWPNEVEGVAAIRQAGFTYLSEDGSEQIQCSGSFHALDVIGPIWRGGSWDPETGGQLEAPVLLQGWHVNFIGDLPEAWEPYVLTPLNPVRVFA